MGQQGIQRPGADAREQAGPAHNQQVVGSVPAGLGHQTGAETVMDQPARKQHAAERGMIHIGVAGDQQHVQSLPAQGAHFFTAHGQETRLIRKGRSFRLARMFPPGWRGAFLPCRIQRRAGRFRPARGNCARLFPFRPCRRAPGYGKRRGLMFVNGHWAA